MKNIILILTFMWASFLGAQNVTGLGTTASSMPTVVINPNIVSNGTFDDGTDWSLASGWAIGSGTLNGTSVTSLATQSSPAITPTNGVTYVATFDVTNYSGSGDFAIRVGGTNSADTGGGNGSYSIEIVSGADGIIRVDGRSPAFTGSIDNLEIREK